MKCCEIDAGKLRKRVSLQRISKVPDGGGGYDTSWSEYAQAWAWVKPLSGAEQLVGMQLEASITHDVIIRHRDGVTAADKIVLENSRELNILSVIDIEERNRWLQLRCQEGAGFLPGALNGS